MLQVTHFSKTVVDTFVVYVTFMLALGYSITKIDLSLFEIKCVFGLTAAKFLSNQIVSTLGGLQMLASVLLVLIVVFDFFALVTIVGFMLNALRSVNVCLHVVQE